MFKKKIGLLSILLFVLLLTACGEANTTKPIDTAAPTTTKAVISTTTTKEITTIATTTTESAYGEMSIPNLVVYKKYPKYIPVYFTKDRYPVTYEYNSENISIENGIITVLSETSNMITVTAKTEHHQVSFKVKACDEYVSLSSNSSNFDNKYASRLNTVQSKLLVNGQPVNNSMIYIGDSFFDTDSFYTNFYTVFSGKNIVSIGVNSATTREVREWINTLVIPYNPKALVLHIGTNDLGDLKLSSTMVSQNVIEVLSILHVILPETKIYWASIEYRKAGFSSYTFEEGKVVIEETNALIKEYIDETENVYYLDSISKLSEDGNPIVSKYRDNIHITLESYQVYIDLLNELGVNFNDYSR